jgi:beta-phosphoglucomutase-like phosphatase (HAD superfamily)
MPKSWMAELATHYENARRRYSEDRLLILFDIDGTILDMRYLVWRLLKIYDRNHGTDFFTDLPLSDISVHEDRITPLLTELKIQVGKQQQILAWYNARSWSPAAVLEAHRPFSGVLEVIRWFQMQPNTYVGLNTARSESLRAETLLSMNRLGQEYKVRFSDELLYMCPDDWAKSAPEAKAAGVRRFQQAGYRVVAFIDNEPENLEAISTVDPAREILLLHADTIFQSQREKLPPTTIAGNAYQLSELIPEGALPRHIQFVWRGIDDPTNMDRFLASGVHWGQFDPRPDPADLDLLLNLASFLEQPVQKEKTWRTLDAVLARLRDTERGIKIDLSENGPVMDQVLQHIKAQNWDDARLWFSAKVENLEETGFRKLVAAHPGAIVECPVGFMAPLICSTPTKSREILEMFKSWGINRFSISWQTPNLRPLFDQMDRWGFEVDIHDVPDLESFLQAVLLNPRSITSDLNFPEWQRSGYGSGKNGRHHNRSLQIHNRTLTAR